MRHTFSCNKTNTYCFFSSERWSSPQTFTVIRTVLDGVSSAWNLLPNNIRQTKSRFAFEKVTKTISHTVDVTFSYCCCGTFLNVFLIISVLVFIINSYFCQPFSNVELFSDLYVCLFCLFLLYWYCVLNCCLFLLLFCAEKAQRPLCRS